MICGCANRWHASAPQALVEKATGAFKSVGLLCFMMWMSGSQLHIFSIMSTMSGVFQPLSAILSSGKSGCLHSVCICLCSSMPLDAACRPVFVVHSSSVSPHHATRAQHSAKKTSRSRQKAHS